MAQVGAWCSIDAASLEPLYVREEGFMCVLGIRLSGLKIKVEKMGTEASLFLNIVKIGKKQFYDPKDEENAWYVNQ